MKLFLSLFLILTLSACTTQRFAFDQDSYSDQIADEEKDLDFFIGGIFQTERVKLRRTCGADEIAEVAFTQTFVDGFIGGLTWGIYTPRTAKIYCSEKKRK